jgi:hypothetical protein
MMVYRSVPAALLHLPILPRWPRTPKCTDKLKVKLITNLANHDLPYVARWRFVVAEDNRPPSMQTVYELVLTFSTSCDDELLVVKFYNETCRFMQMPDLCS